jgi:transposase InsO family protein
LGIEHHLTRQRTPQTNSNVERFNSRISAILKTHLFLSGEGLAETLRRDIFL